MQESRHEIEVRGIPKIENMPKGEWEILCKALLREVEKGHSKRSGKIKISNSKVIK